MIDWSDKRLKGCDRGEWKADGRAVAHFDTRHFGGSITAPYLDSELLAGHIERRPPKPRARFSDKVLRETGNPLGCFDNGNRLLIFTGGMKDQEVRATELLMEGKGYLCSHVYDDGLSRLYGRCAKIKPRGSKELGDTGTCREAIGSVLLGLIVFGAGGFLMYALSYMLIMILKSIP